MFPLKESGAMPDRNRCVEFDSTSTYRVGKSIAAVDSIFRTDGSVITDILSRLIRADAEQTG
jgi:S1-C subfamily serine protease